ncbi:MAG: hypothetical protein M1823_002755 [Watsoniomyces obsoletus]|nr:MAG: hypothetical protein M1823_002755 [Watsoniomyces obsoletus]
MENLPLVDDIHDDRPIAIRRKRRTLKPVTVGGGTATETETTVPPAEKTTGAEAVMESNHIPEETISHQQEQDPITPSTSPRKKRVRFSAPAPGVLLFPPSSSSSSSTGLTPSLKRHRLLSSPRRAHPKSPRRATLPARLTSPRSPLRSPRVIQFAPLRQIIDGRVKRRLRRNHLSEELNKIAKEKRLEKQLCETSVAALRDELKEKDRRVIELKKQIVALKRQSLEVPLMNPGTNISFESWTGFGNEGSFQDGVQTDSQQDEIATVLEEPLEAEGYEDVVGPAKEMGIVEEFSALEESLVESITTVPTVFEQNVTLFENQVSTDDHLKKQVEMLQESLQQATSELEKTRSTHDRLSSKLQSHLQDASISGNETDMDTALNKVLTTLVLAQARAEDAEEALAILSSEVAAVGFDGRNAEEMLDAIRDQFRQARLELEYLQPGETVDNQKLLGLLIGWVRKLTQNLRDGEEERETQHRVRTSLQQRLEKAYDETKHAEDKARELQLEVDEKERSIWNLQRALDGYRTEVKSLEDLVNHLEREHQETTAGLRNTMDEAVADLEEKLEMEMKNKEDVLLEAQDDKQLREELQKKVEQAQKVIDRISREKHEMIVTKDAIIAYIDSEARDREVTDAAALAECRSELDAIGQESAELATNLDEAQENVKALTEAKITLEARLAVEMENGVRVMDDMESEMKKCLARVDKLKKDYANSKDGSATMSLPPTPCSLRFNSPMKKRRKFDSGIGVIEETDEVMMDVGPVEG